MLLKYFYDETLAQASYLLGCPRTGEAMVVDPGRDVEAYLRAADKEGLRITHVTETHIHADFVSGLRELAARTGALMMVSDEGGPDWTYAFAGEANVVPVRGGDTWKVGNVKVDVLRTPGHTPEHIAFMITDTAGANRPIGIFTGDFVFVGDVGRPDLLEEAAGMLGTKEIGARKQFESVARLKALPDYLQLWPGHGAGSACGKALGAIPSTTLGYERLFNPAFQFEQEDAFVAWLLAGQPEAPRYFAQMKRVNKLGAALLTEATPPRQMNREELDALLAAGAQVFDLRRRDAFAKAHLPGAISIPTTDNSYLTYIGWYVDYARPAYFIAPSLGDVERITRALRSIGIDDTPGFFAPEVVAGSNVALPVWTAKHLAERQAANGLLIVDVRGKSEYDTVHIAGAKHIPVGLLPRRLAELPHDRLLVTQCASGYRSQIAASYLRAQGFDAVTLGDGEKLWSQALPVEA
ncbi:MAG TPA: rhodanese-like domain-containing protein [Thermoflexales bacterium]|nr:rhodanese-like domain-containing protein [Thermoflexales bacterium]